MALKILMPVMIVSVMMATGLQVDRERLVATLRQYGLLGRAMLANFVLLPLFALLLVRLFHVERDVAIGIVLMSMAPGVPFLVNSAGRKSGGSLSFAVTIAFCFAALSVITIPVTIALIAMAFPAAPVVTIPTGKFLTTLVVFQLVPLVAGALIAPYLAPRTAERIASVLQWVFAGAALLLIVLIFPRLVDSVNQVYGHGNFAIMAAVGAFAASMGWLLGGPDERHRRTLAIATLMRNVGLCLLIGAGPEFQNTDVEPAIIAYLIVSFVLSVPIRAYFKRAASTATGRSS